MSIFFRFEIFLLLQMVLKGAVVEKHKWVLEVEGQLFFRDCLELTRDGFQDHEFIVIGLVVVVMVVVDMKKKQILTAIGGHSDAIQLGKRNSPFDLVLVLNLDELLDEHFEKIGIFENIEDCLIGDEEDSFLAFPMAIIFQDVC